MTNQALLQQGQAASQAAQKLAQMDTQERNNLLAEMAKALENNIPEILAANEKDMQAGKDNNLSEAMLDRLLLTEERIGDMAEGLRALIALPDPLGEVEKMWHGAQNIQIGKLRVPLGVIGIIYEARPNVTVDAAGICLKTGNAAFLRGSSSAFNSNQVLVNILNQAGKKIGAPDGAVSLVQDNSREVAAEMMKMDQYIDVLIPRGGANLIRVVIETATIPVIETGAGNCHTYIDDEADLEMAHNIVVNAKTQRPSTCNTLETLLIHQDVAEEYLQNYGPKLAENGVHIKGCEKTINLYPNAALAQEADFAEEYLNLTIAIKIVADIDEAIEHINKYNTKHSDAIITNNYFKAQKFMKNVDAACVYVNASTRFTDGFQFGFGAEIGVSNQKLHARGPMGLYEMTTYKYIICGEGQVRA